MSAAVRYRVRHETVYGYGGNVAHSHQLLHLIPREVPRQSCLAHTLTLNPQPARRSEGIDAFGNPVTRLEYDQPHDRLEVLAELAVDVRAPAPAAASDSAEWEAVSGSLAFTGKPMRPDLLEASRYRMESSYVSLKQAFTAYGADCFTPRRPLLEAAAALSAKIHREFKFAPGSTDIRTSAIEAFAARQGVCQDFSHIMIACLRSRGVAARYVSGYRRRDGPCWGRRLARLGVRVLSPFRLGRSGSDQRHMGGHGPHRDRLGPGFRRRLAAARRDRGRRPASADGASFSAGGVRSTGNLNDMVQENQLGKTELPSREEAQGGGPECASGREATAPDQWREFGRRNSGRRSRRGSRGPGRRRQTSSTLRWRPGLYCRATGQGTGSKLCKSQ